MPFDPAALPDDVDALKAIIADMARDAVAAKSEIEKLSVQLARLKRAQFGRSSEKLRACVEQLELALEALESDQAERLAAVPAIAELVEAEHDKIKPARRPLPDHLPREEIVHAGACSCPPCGGSLRRIGADVTETLDYVPGRFKSLSPT
jgi:transposase